MRFTHLIRVATIAATVAVALAPAAVPVGITPANAQGRPDMPGPLSSETIRALQQALNDQGIKVAIDGVMGTGTREAIRAYQSQHHLPVTGMPDQATLDKLGVTAERRVPGDPRPTQRAQGPAGPGQMGPGQMGPGQMGPGQMGQSGQGQMGMMGGGMMSPQMMQMMHQMMGGQSGMMGSGAMAGMQGPMAGWSDGTMGIGMMAGLLYGGPAGEMTVERVSKIVDGLLAWHGNARLKLGKVTQEGGEIIAEIVTQDDSLVQKLAFNRYPGVVRAVP